MDDGRFRTPSKYLAHLFKIASLSVRRPRSALRSGGFWALGTIYYLKCIKELLHIVFVCKGLDFISRFAQPGVLHVSESSPDCLTYDWIGSLTRYWADIADVSCVFGFSLQGVPGFLCHSYQTSLGVCELLVLGNPLLKSKRCLWRPSSSHLHIFWTVFQCI